MKRYLIIHYGEIGLKLANKNYFVEKLRQRIKIKFEQKFRSNFSVKHTLGRLLIALDDDFEDAAGVAILMKVFGIKNFKFAFSGPVEVEKLGDVIWESLQKEVLNASVAPKNFRVSVKRSMKMSMKSIEMERELGAVLLDKGLDLKVKLKDPDLVVDVEFFNEKAFFSFKKYAALGGLSANSQSKLVALVSAGIDSPVAAYRMMRRGARIIFVHFHGYPYTDKDEMEQVKDLVKILGEYQFGTKLYLVPYGVIQRAIATNLDIPAKVRTILYRRIMLKIAEKIAYHEQAKGLVTGDSFGQVASQTPENIFAIHDAASIPLFQPLISFDKDEVIKIAEEIGTFEISKLPCKDTCTMFMPKKPELKANVYEIRDFEKLLPVDEWVKTALKEAELLAF